MAVFLSPVGGAAAQFFDNDGVPLAGGLIYTYAAGTSTPAATYTTSSGLIQHSNPIILDAAGRVPTGEIWLTDGSSYKFVIKTGQEVLIATYDNVTGINSNFIAYTSQQEIQTATAGQTVFNLTTMQYQPGTNNLSVFVDGVNQYGPGAQYAYTETDSDTVTFVTGLHVGASVKFTTASPVASAVVNAENVAYTYPAAGAVTQNVEERLAQYVSVKDFGAIGDGVADDTTAIQNAVDECPGKILFFPEGTYNLSDTITINTQLTLIGDTQGNTVIQKTTADIAFKVLSSNVKFIRFKINGGISGDTTSGIQIGQNDGANGQGTGYIDAAQCLLQDVFINDCGNYGVDWEEGPFVEFNNVHCFDALVNNFYVSDKAFDASHGLWYTNSAGAGADGYSINWGSHVFQLAKSYSDTGRGFYLSNSRGTVGAIFVELSGGAFIEFASSTLACNINVQFWTAGKNYVDAGIGNKLIGMSLGNNNGGAFETFTRTNKILVKNEFVANGGSVLNGGFQIEQSANNNFAIGDPANTYTCNLISGSAGVSLQQVACHSRVFDLSSFSSPQDLTVDNQHISDFLLVDTQTIRLNGASGTSYVPFDGQTVTIWVKGTGTVNIYGKIDSSLQTVTLTGTNVSRTYMWQSAQNYWFIKT